MSLERALFRPCRDDVWRQLADQVEGRFIDGGLLGTDVIQVTSGDWIITLDTQTQIHGQRSTTYTRLRAPYVNPEEFFFAIIRGGFFAGLDETPGMHGIEVGYPGFDDNYAIRGNSGRRVRKFCENERIRELVELQPRIHLEVRDDGGWFKSSFPAGVDELYFRGAGVVENLRQLQRLFELFAESLHQLCHDGRAYQDDVDIHLRRLLMVK